MDGNKTTAISYDNLQNIAHLSAHAPVKTSRITYAIDLLLPNLSAVGKMAFQPILHKMYTSQTMSFTHELGSKILPKTWNFRWFFRRPGEHPCSHHLPEPRHGCQWPFGDYIITIHYIPMTHLWDWYRGFLKWWYPQIIDFNRVFQNKPSILGYHYFWKHPYVYLDGCFFSGSCR